jgi:LytTr DNA-binding domain
MMILRQAYPLTTDMRRIVLQNTLIGVFVAFFLIVFQPFGTDQWQVPYKSLKLAGYGGVAFVGASLVYWVLYNCTDRYRMEANWTVGREILMSIAIMGSIAFGNLLYANGLGLVSLSAKALFNWLTIVVAVGIFPIVGMVLLRYERYKTLNQSDAAHMSDRLQQQVRPAAAPVEVVTFTSDNEKDTPLSLRLDELRYIESADNYATFVYVQDHKVQKRLLRGALRRFEGQAAVHPDLVRCHRSYIVNLSQVISVSGNAQGYRLTIRDLDMQVPVARQYGPAILERL